MRRNFIVCGDDFREGFSSLSDNHYFFNGQVVGYFKMAYLLLLGSGERCALNETQIGIGRAPDNEVVVADAAVSIYHAHVVLEQPENKKNLQQYVIEDLDSTNSTFVNNKEVKRSVLKDGDIIRVGNTRMKFSSAAYEPPPPDFQATQKIKKVKTSDYLYTRKG